ncbi:MAG: dTDP-glucose 4,6-dehydratase, partial [Candidatus Theseobacter exili]|nr:dTDP-glucose 4,6-dehydratase [Candidatus Theseobacter exili]
NLKDVQDDSRYKFVHGDIADEALVDSLLKEKIDYLVNFAAESHVDRSIGNPADFIQTDIFGAYVLLEASRKHGVKRFLQISTDEVYGSIESGAFVEQDRLMPSNPYSASKAGADRLCYSYWATYNLPVLITRASNNYGPYQYPEKFVPVFITNALENKNLPLYGDGLNIRDWLYVTDHCRALEVVLEKGKLGEVYNVGGGSEKQNIEVARGILEKLELSESLIQLVKDRPGHDRRYSLNFDKLKTLGWVPLHDYKKGLNDTINWYKCNDWWWKKIKSGDHYKDYYDQHYNKR